MIDVACKPILRGIDARVFVETGTDMGETVAEVSQWFAEWDPAFGFVQGFMQTGLRSYNPWNEPIAYPQFRNVESSEYELHTVDVDDDSVANARRMFASNEHIGVHQESSEQWVRRFVDERKASGDGRPVFFFLDAHWGKYWPLRDELKAIRSLERYALVIDDFMVPGKSNPAFPHGDFGFDLYRSRVLNWAYIRDLFESDDVRVFYPQASNRDKRGWVLMLHGYSDDELAFLAGLPLFEVPKGDPRHAMSAKPHPMAYLDLKNLVKKVVPVTVLRALIRGYQTLSFRKSSS